MIIKNFLEIHLNGRRKKTRFQKERARLTAPALFFFCFWALLKDCGFFGSQKAEAGPSGTRFFFGARLSQNSVVFLAPKKQNHISLGSFWK